MNILESGLALFQGCRLFQFYDIYNFFKLFWIWGMNVHIMISVEKSWVEIFCFINKVLEAHQKILLKLLLEKFSLLWLNLKLILEMFLLMLDYKKYFPLPVTLFLRTKMVHHFLSHQVHCSQWATARLQSLLILRPFWGYFYIHIHEYIRYVCFLLDFHD